MLQAITFSYDRSDPNATRRRIALLTALVALPVLLMTMGAWQVWPLLMVPVALAGVLAGVQGLALVSAVTALAMAIVSDRPGASGGQMAVALLGAVALSLVVAGRHAAMQRDLRRAATESLTDRLTGLPNYAFLCDALPRELRRAERYGHPVSLVLLDIDRFKRFNDQHGHGEGNRLLARVGGTLLACARASDMPARFGGEEFAIVVPGPLSEATEAAERIRRAIGETRVSTGGGVAVAVTVSVGVAEHVAGERLDGADLIARADRALYAAKQGGRDRTMVLRAGAVEPQTAATVIGAPRAVRRVA